MAGKNLQTTRLLLWSYWFNAMRGYFGIGSEHISKAMNFGAILRTAHAFGATFAFTVGPHKRLRDLRRSDTSKALTHVPYYEWPSVEALQLPAGCMLVGVELEENARALPQFRHPQNAAYLLGPEKGSLSKEALARCDHLVKIPTRFCVNLSVAAAIIMYDRTLSLGGYPVRPLSAMPAPADSDWRPISEK